MSYSSVMTENFYTFCNFKPIVFQITLNPMPSPAIWVLRVLFCLPCVLTLMMDYFLVAFVTFDYERIFSRAVLPLNPMGSQATWVTDKASWRGFGSAPAMVPGALDVPVFNFSWSIVALQWCVCFCCAAMWISHTYTYIPSSLDFLPTEVITSVE